MATRILIMISMASGFSDETIYTSNLLQIFKEKLQHFTVCRFDCTVGILSIQIAQPYNHLPG